MKWEVERVGTVERKIRVEVAPEAVNVELTEAYRAVGKNAQLKGFRKGKAPKGLLRRYYGAQVSEEVAEKLVQKNIENALQEADLEPVGNVSIDRGTVAENTSYEFTVTFDVMPLPEKLELGDITIDWPDTAPTKEDIGARLQELRQMKAELVPVEDRPSAMGDTINVSMNATCEGEVLAGTQAEQQDIELDGERLLPGLAEGMVGLSDGDEKDVPISFPEDFADPNLAGKEAIFSVTVHGVKTQELPELDDEFAIDLGLENLEQLETRITDELARTKDDEGQRQVRDSLFDQLIEKNPLEIPESLISMRTREMMSMFFQNLEKQGISPQSLGERLPEQLEHFKVQAGRLCHERALTKAIVDSASLTVTEEDLKSRVETFMGDVPEEQREGILEGFLQGESRQRLKSQVEYEKVLEHVVGPRPAEKAGKGTAKAKKAAGKTAAKKKAPAKKKAASAKKAPAKKADGADKAPAKKKTTKKKTTEKKSEAKE